MQFPNENQKITMVTGKGGVGKSAIAAAMAEVYARRGLKTLLVELGDHSYYQYVYETPIRYEPTRIFERFYIARWSGESALREYVYYLIRVRKLVDLFFENKIMRTFIRAAPALKELAILGKITSGIREWGPPLDFDRIIVDGFSTGHFLALLQAPVGMADLIESGPMGEQSRRIRDVLGRPDLSQYYIVTLPEEFPVVETIELKAELQAHFKVDAQVICNRLYETTMTTAWLEQFSNQSFAEFLVNTKTAQACETDRLRQGVRNFITLPLIFSDSGRIVIEALSRELDAKLEEA